MVQYTSICPEPQERCESCSVVVRRRQVQRCLAARVLRVWISAVSEQRAGDGVQAVAARHVQGGARVVVPGVDVCPPCQQRLHSCDAGAGGRDMQRRTADAVPAVRGG